jgi:hypothetical protein
MPKIAFISTRGIPNEYGGFEQFAEFISVALLPLGYDVTVYNPSFHSFKGNNFKGVHIIHKWSPEKQIGSAANFIYDYLSLKDALQKDFDIIYIAGYTTIFPSFPFLKKKHPCKIVVNLDGLEYKRSKYNYLVKRFIVYCESLALEYADFLVSDNKGIQQYYKDKYAVDSFFIPYGAVIPERIDDSLIKQYNLNPNQYYMLLARFEPENNIEMIIDGYIQSKSQYPLFLIGNSTNKYGQQLIEKYKMYPQVVFQGVIYDRLILDSLRKQARLYFHGHSVGGTNPSLLEAMASSAYIAAHQNEFNGSVLQQNALYFSNDQTVKLIIQKEERSPFMQRHDWIQSNLRTIEEHYTWPKITDLHHRVFTQILHTN